MKKILSFVSILIGFMLPTNVFAGNYGLRNSSDVTYAIRDGAGLPNASAQNIIGGVIQTSLTLVGLLFFGLTVYAGIRWIIARGNEEEVKNARSTLITSVIGLAIVLAAYALTAFFATIV